MFHSSKKGWEDTTFGAALILKCHADGSDNAALG